MAKGLPWAGAYKNPGKASDQYAPAGGHPGPDAAAVVGNSTSESGFVHDSLKSSQKPDKSPIGKRTYG